VATTTVRLTPDDERLLDDLATAYGGRSNAIREALRQLGAVRARQEALGRFLADWEADAGPVDEATVAAMAERFDV
jgi:Arc/MetJ-type ribon-helix-helix transcriptional regulator